MASELHVDAIKHSGGTSALTIDSSGNVHKAGMIIQVVESSNDGSDTSTTSTSLVDTGHSVTITPKFNTSKILITMLGGRITYGAVGAIHVELFASIGGGSYSQVTQFVDALTQSSSYGMNMAGRVLHSPNTTSTIIYKTQFKSSNGNAQYYTSSSQPVSLTATEVAQ